MKLFTSFLREEEGQDLIEYALLGSFVSLAAYAGATYLGEKYNTWFTAVGVSVDGAASAVPQVGS